MNAPLPEALTEAKSPSTGLLSLRTAIAAVLAIVGAIALAIAAGAAMNPPTSDTVTYPYAVTNTGTAPIDSIRVRDPAMGELDATISCPNGSLEPGTQMTCEAKVAGPADRAHASKVTTALLVGGSGLALGAITGRRRR